MQSDVKVMLAKIERQLDDYAKIKAIWQKHCMSLRCGDVAQSLDEVLCHYAGFVAAEKQEKERKKAARFEESADEAKRQIEENWYRLSESERIEAQNRGMRNGYRSAFSENVVSEAKLETEAEIRGKLREASSLNGWGAKTRRKITCRHDVIVHDCAGHWFCDDCEAQVKPPEVIA